MAGNTGKMTKEAIRQRGPRLVLARILSTGEMVMYREGNHPTGQYSVLAKSYSKRYLEKLIEPNRTAEAR